VVLVKLSLVVGPLSRPTDGSAGYSSKALAWDSSPVPDTRMREFIFMSERTIQFGQAVNLNSQDYRKRPFIETVVIVGFPNPPNGSSFEASSLI